MKNYHCFYVICLLFFAETLFAQSNRMAKDAVKTTISQFFKGMENGDTALLRSTCTSAPILQTYMADKSGNMKVHTQDFNAFVDFVGAERKDKYKEKINFGAVHVEESLASVWTPYVFYLNGKIVHTGTNSFQLVRTEAGWKIQYIIDTRRR